MRSKVQSSGTSLTRLLFAGAFFTCLLTIIGFFGEYHWLFDIASHFRIQYLIFLTIAAGIFWFKKRCKELCFNGLAIAINLVCILPIYYEVPASEAGMTRPYTALILNLHYTNENYDLAADYLEDIKPDILLLMEFSPYWKDGLDSVLQKYPSRVIEMRDDPFGIGIYSNFIINEGMGLELGGTDIPSLKIKFDIDGKPLSFFAVHLMPPFGQLGSEMRNSQMNGLQKLVKSDTSKRIMILGDINMTPWSPIFQKFESNTMLKNVRKGFGILATWPANLKPLGIPLDHGFVSPNIIIRDIETGPHVGSDHLPLKITFGLN
jgi:endonuclease/exonuclease/phosphatase (EEP) superfamily protein YafD